MDTWLLWLFYLISLGASCQGIAISVPGEEKTLEYYLCDHGLNESDTTLILASNATHSINGRNSLCIVDNISNITIKSDTPASLATVNCINNHTTGFAFLNASKVTLIDVVFNGCGGNIGNDNLLESLNHVPTKRKDPYYKFQELNRVTLLFHNSSDITMHNVHVTNYTGFGIIFTNLFGYINTTHLNITNALNSGCDTCIAGSGLLMIFNTERMSGNASVHMSSVEITEGYTTEFNDSLVEEIDDNTKDPHPLIRVAAGLSVIISEPNNPSHIVNIVMDNLIIRNNCGGGIVLVYVNTVYSNITIDTANISSCLPARLNSQNKIGESLTVYYALTDLRLQQGDQFDYSLSLLHVNFTALISDSCRSKYGNLFLGEKAFNLTSVMVRAIGEYVGQRVTDNHFQRVMLRNVYFAKDFPGVTDEDLGIGLYVYSFNSIAMTLENVTAIHFSCSDSGYEPDNPYYSCERVGSLAFKHMKDLQVVGGQFTHHHDCSVFFVHNSPLKLSGNITVSDNMGVFYGALQLLRSSQLQLVEPLFLYLNHNKALYGGAVYVYDEFNIDCGIQVVPKVNSTFSNMNITLKISNNEAVLSGNTIYGYRLHHCDRINQQSENTSLFNILLKLMDPKQNRSETREIASPASLVCICNDSNTIPHLPCVDHIQSKNYSNVYPGHVINVHLVTTDSSVSVYGTVTARFIDIPPDLYVHLSQQQVSASVAAASVTGGQCTGVNFTIYHNATSETNVTLEIAATSQISQAFLHLTLVGCSNGLAKTNDKYGGRCKCLDVYEDFGCINGSINRYADSWIGYTSDEKYGYTYVCPSGFCNDSLTTTTIITNLNVSSPICIGGRTGTMCTICPRGKSVVFGSVDCKSCSNWYIVTILFYAVCGLLLVAMLFLLQLTVRTGTINGLIFYANLLSTGFTLGYLLEVNPNLYLLRVFVSFINLNLGFPLCFYNGMDEEVNRLLQFVFPVYVWIIIGLIIVISKRSPKLSSLIGRHCVSVLATLIQLSYSKILTNVTESFSFAHVYVMDSAPDSKVTTSIVWFFAGVKYGSPLHITHILISLTFLLIFVVPFTLIITFAPFLGKYRFTSKHIVSKYMPFLDAIYAPYKEKWRCWFGARLCLLLVLLICRASLSGYSFRWNVGVQFLSVILFTFLQVHYKPFKNMFIHCLDVFFMLNFCFCAFFAIALPNDKPLFVTITTFVTIAFIVFIGIIIYHIYFVFLKESIPCIWLGKKMGISKTSNVFKHSQSEVSLKSSMESYCNHGSFDRLREPMLDYIDNDEGTSTNSY